MWDPPYLTTLQASKACYGGNFILLTKLELFKETEREQGTSQRREPISALRSKHGTSPTLHPPSPNMVQESYLLDKDIQIKLGVLSRGRTGIAIRNQRREIQYFL
jgi:hypothetical protein